MNHLEDNLKALQPRAPQLVGLLANESLETAMTSDSDGSWELLAARSGAPTARTAKGWLHSRYDPAKEAGRIAEESLNVADTLVCIGLGLGYLAEVAIRAGHMVLVLEYDAAWLKRCLSARDLSILLTDERFSLALCPDGEAVLAVLHNLQAGRITVVENPLFAASFGDVCLSYRLALKRYQDKETINLNTLRRFGKLWVRNIAKNLPLLATCPGVEVFERQFTGIPALILTAGPSLDAILPRIAELRERCLLICVDTALRSLLRYGLEPDFLLVVDPQLYNSWHLQYYSAPASILVSEAAVWPSVLRDTYRQRLLCASQYPLGQALEQRSGMVRGRLGAGGSVATTAWDLARLLGCTPVYMAGLDLSFPGKQTHAKASLFEQRSLFMGTRLKPASGLQFTAALGGQPYRALANDGTMVTTDKRLALYAWWYTRTLARYPETATWNLSAEGLAIDGMPYRDTGDLTDLPIIRSSIDRVLAEGCARAAATNSTIQATAFEQARVSIQTELQAIGQLAGQATELCTSVLETGQNLTDILHRLDQIDQAVLQNSARDIAGFLFPDAQEIIGEKSRDLQGSIEKTARLYRQISDSINWHLEILAEQTWTG